MQQSRLILKHLRTSTSNKPTSDIIEEGELALCTNADSPRLYIKLIDGGIATFVDEEYVKSLFSSLDNRLSALEGSQPILHNITTNLTHTVSTNTANTILNGAEYIAVLSAEAHYVIGNVQVIMGGEDITIDVYDSSTHTITIASATGDISIIAESVKIMRTITYNFTGATLSNLISSIEDGSPYSGTIEVNTNHEITNVSVLMGGQSVTTIVYHNNLIEISEITGDVVITIEATQIVVTEIGEVNNTKEIVVNIDTLASGNYVLRYEDENGNELPNMNKITTFIV